MDFLFKKSFTFIKNNHFDIFFENLVYFCVVAYIFTHSVSSSVFSKISYVAFISKKLMYLSFVLLAIKIIYDFLRGKFSYIETIFYFFICALGIYVKFFDGFGDLLAYFLFIVSCINVDKEKILKYAFFTLIFSMAIVLTFGQLPFFIQSDKVDVRYGVERIRYGLGYLYTTHSANYFLGLSFLSVIFIKRFNIIHYIIFIIANIYIFIMTDTKSVFLCVFVLLILKFAVDRSKNMTFTKILGFLTFISYPLGALLFFILSILYDKNIGIINKLNVLTTGRIGLTYKGIVNWGIHLFGYRTYMIGYGPNYNYIDSSYMNILLNDGIIALLVVLIIFTLFAYFAYKKNDKYIIIYLFVLSLHSLLDPQLISIPCNPYASISLLYVLDNLKQKNIL